MAITREAALRKLLPLGYNLEVEVIREKEYPQLTGNKYSS
jgi:hypothetical protein